MTQQKTKHPKLILLRHGQSEWNRLNQFTGWVDIPLSAKGIEEACAAGRHIAEIPIDVIFVSSLIRATMTAMLAMSVHQSGKVPCLQHPLEEGERGAWAKIYSHEAEKNCIPVFSAWQLNERMYGKLQGLNKAETIKQYGEDQVKLWRRSFDTRPPEGESLAMTAERALPYFNTQIVPHLKQGKNVLISAHGNSLRAIIMHLEGLTKEEVIALELETGRPIIYQYHSGKWEK